MLALLRLAPRYPSVQLPGHSVQRRRSYGRKTTRFARSGAMLRFARAMLPPIGGAMCRKPAEPLTLRCGAPQRRPAPAPAKFSLPARRSKAARAICRAASASYTMPGPQSRAQRDVTPANDSSKRTLTPSELRHPLPRLTRHLPPSVGSLHHARPAAPFMPPPGAPQHIRRNGSRR